MRLAPRPAVLLLALLAAPAVAVPAAADAPATVRAVVSWDGERPALPGAVVVDELPALSAAVVDVRADRLDDLARVRGVRGVAPDAPLTLTGSAGEGDGVPAATGLGGSAGKKAAGAGVRVAVVDTGVSDTAALDRASGRLVDAFSADGASGPYVDGYGHGTFMASVVAGGPVPGSDGRPVGVAPGATVLVVRVADAQGRTSLSQVLAGLDWVVDHADAVDVANLSFAHARPGQGYGADPLVDAVAAVREAGVLPVVSAGNLPDRVGDPGFAPQALTVGAADLTAKKASVASFSGSAVVSGVRKPDVVANGVSVLGVLPEGSAIAVEHPDARQRQSLWRGTGTSQAAAVASGVAALHLADRRGDSPRQVKAALRAAAGDLAGSRDGAGLLRSPSRGGGKGGSEPPPAATGEAGFDSGAWAANSWSANSWSANGWAAGSWSANSWSASSWSARWDR